MAFMPVYEPLGIGQKRTVGPVKHAADVAQEAFVRAYRQLDSFKGESRFGAWLRRIAVNTALMRLRSRRRRPETSLDAMLPEFVEDGHHAEPVERIHTASPEDALLHRQAIHQTLSELPEHYREVVLMRRVEGLDTEETARKLGISVNAV